LQSDSHNLKYMGIDALGRLIKINPDIAEEHQLAVIDCLEVRVVPFEALKMYDKHLFCDMFLPSIAFIRVTCCSLQKNKTTILL
jgi:hypothetical protein